ncbi:MAG TPA: hypothetical protein VFT53_05160 [Candidatus Saccharimonadales bacterium]|nr:hypothetical protein [Candidatus Saccharimonadales bacterium]
MSKLDKLKQLEQAIPTVKPVHREVVASVPIGKPESTGQLQIEKRPVATKSKVAPKVTTVVEPQPETLAMPPSRDAQPRVQVIFRPVVDLNERLKQFCEVNHASIQDTCSLALEEFLNRRNA